MAGGGAVRMAEKQVKEQILSVGILDDFSLLIQLSPWLLVLFTIFVVLWFAYLLFRKNGLFGSVSSFELDEAEFGIGSQKLKLKANLTDQQVAYAIWVELSTRKIGLPIDLDHDVVSEIYDSWYTFFQVTRELIKTIPVSKVQGQSTQIIINLSVNVLNRGIRPHLTNWQARFRRWYDAKIAKQEDDGSIIDPQDIQKNYPKWEELFDDMVSVNKRLIAYRRKMEQLVWQERKSKAN